MLRSVTPADTRVSVFPLTAFLFPGRIEARSTFSAVEQVPIETSADGWEVLLAFNCTPLFPVSMVMHLRTSQTDILNAAAFVGFWINIFCGRFCLLKAGSILFV